MPSRFALQRESAAHSIKATDPSSSPRFTLKVVPIPPVMRTFLRRLSGDRFFSRKPTTFGTNFTSRSSISAASSTLSQNNSTVFSYGRDRRLFSLSASHVSSSSEPSAQKLDVRKEVDKVSELYDAALEEMDYAEESKDSFYYREDHQTASKAVEDCVCSYESLLKVLLCETDRDEVRSCLESKVQQLRAQFDALPPSTDLPLH